MLKRRCASQHATIIHNPHQIFTTQCVSSNLLRPFNETMRQCLQYLADSQVDALQDGQAVL